MNPNKDKSKTTYSLIIRDNEKKIPPRIIFNKTAMRWIDAMIELHETEVGFYAIVDSLDNYTFLVRDVFYPKHLEAHGTTCEISKEGESEIMEWLVNKGREEDIPKMKLWGHSHVNMGTSPSGQDETQAMRIINDSQDFLIRIICNKKGEMSCSFFDYKNNIRFDNINWEIDNKIPDSEIEKILFDSMLIINNTNVDRSERLENLKKLINGNSEELILIKNKILELKEVNIPKPKNSFYGNTFSVTNNYLEQEKKDNKKLKSSRGFFYNNKKDRDPNDSIIDELDSLENDKDDNISEIITDWRESLNSHHSFEERFGF